MEIVTDEPPLLVNVSETLALLPIATIPSERLDGFGLSAPCDTPVPATGMLKLGFEPLDVAVMFPLAAPVVAGEKVTVNEVLCPVASVTGIEGLAKLNPVPLTDTAEIVTLVPPLLVRVSDWLLLVPTVTLPKLMLLGLGERAPWVMPLPESGMPRLEFDALEVIVSVPFALPDAVGLNRMLNDAFWPLVKVIGNDNPLTVNPVPVRDELEMVTLSPPVLVREAANDLEVETWTLPKLKLAGLAVSDPAASPLPIREIAKLAFEALETILSVPVAEPEAVGSKVTVKEAL